MALVIDVSGSMSGESLLYILFSFLEVLWVQPTAARLKGEKLILISFPNSFFGNYTYPVKRLM